jgi:hypothetical protein
MEIDPDDLEEFRRGAEPLKRQLNSMRETCGLSEKEFAAFMQDFEVNDLIAQETAKHISERLASESPVGGVLELMNFVLEQRLQVMEIVVEMRGKIEQLTDVIGQLRSEIDQMKKRVA